MSQAPYQPILDFWFEEIPPKQWYVKDPEFDETLRTRFGDQVEQALNGELDAWGDDQKSTLALILLLDQFTRNIYRDTPKAFAGDEKALATSLHAQEAGFMDGLSKEKGSFILMPMMHSESLEVQEASLEPFKKYAPDNTYDYAIAHLKIIKRFGRFPHRNAILNRTSTPEEEAFLKEPGSSF